MAFNQIQSDAVQCRGPDPAEVLARHVRLAFIPAPAWSPDMEPHPSSSTAGESTVMCPVIRAGEYTSTVVLPDGKLLEVLN